MNIGLYFIPITEWIFDYTNFIYIALQKSYKNIPLTKQIPVNKEIINNNIKNIWPKLIFFINELFYLNLKWFKINWIVINKIKQ